MKYLLLIFSLISLKHLQMLLHERGNGLTVTLYWNWCLLQNSLQEYMNELLDAAMALIQLLLVKAIKEMDSMLHSWNCSCSILNEQSSIQINLAMTQCPNSVQMIMHEAHCKVPILCNCANGNKIEIQMWIAINNWREYSWGIERLEVLSVSYILKFDTIYSSLLVYTM